MHTFTKSVFINAPKRKVMGVFGSAANWDLWFVGMHTTNVMATPDIVGMVHEYTRLVMGLHISISSVVEIWSFNQEEGSMRFSSKGDVSQYMQCNFSFRADGVDFTLVHCYSMDEKWLEKVSNKFIDESILIKMIDKADEDSLENLKIICES